MQKNAWHHYLEIYSRESVVPKLILAYQEAIQRYATRCS
jgi:hypothetical protein